MNATDKKTLIAAGEALARTAEYKPGCDLAEMVFRLGGHIFNLNSDDAVKCDTVEVFGPRYWRINLSPWTSLGTHRLISVVYGVVHYVVCTEQGAQPGNLPREMPDDLNRMFQTVALGFLMPTEKIREAQANHWGMAEMAVEFGVNERWVEVRLANMPK